MEQRLPSSRMYVPIAEHQPGENFTALLSRLNSDLLKPQMVGFEHDIGVNHQTSHRMVVELLRWMEYSLQANSKTLEGS